jgi:hypothetical protein
VRCGRCGNENPESHRFCGMCGATLVAKDPAAQEAAEPRSVPASSTAAEARPSFGPVITGPSFLGLNTPAPERLKDQVVERGGQDALRPSANVDYLLEDDDGEPRRGWGKLILFVVALALAVGFGYLHWTQGGFDWLNAGDKKPAAATAPAPDAGQSGADSGGATAAPAAPQAGTAVAGGSSVPAESGTPQTNPQTSSEASSSQTTTSQSAAAANTPEANIPSAKIPAQTAVPQSAEQQSAPPRDAGDSASSASQAPDIDSDKPPAAAEVSPRAVARKPAAAKPAAEKPAPAKPAAAKPLDAVTEAERYIYGRGAGQDCDRGVRLLKAAAEQSNVKAMISLGTLYSTGTCTPRDLPTAYRWFALALHKEPDNQALQNDLQSLWGKMTQPERQLAIKLSQ